MVYGSKVDHLLMPGCPEVENSYQDPFPSLSVFQYSVLIINGCGLEMGVVLLEKKNPPFPSPRSAPDMCGGNPNLGGNTYPCNTGTLCN